MIAIRGNINQFKALLRDELFEFFENNEGIQHLTTETLARWVSDEVGKVILDNLAEDDNDEPEEDQEELVARLYGGD